ncbi:MAG: hypothetical protein MJ177_00695 [Clostridia bacterium]|nr:hypothetical protein [Clostridia bacterium]
MLQQWNNAAERYTNEQEQSEFAESNKRIVKERFRNLSGQKVLDLGCGYGYYTVDFWGETTHFHRPLSYYLNSASEQGFILKHIDEPVSYDGITKNRDLPLFLFAEYQKG